MTARGGIYLFECNGKANVVQYGTSLRGLMTQEECFREICNSNASKGAGAEGFRNL